MDKNTYRGKRKDNGEWVYGYYVSKTDPLLGIGKAFILAQEFDRSCITGEPTVLRSEMTWYEVVPETVGQCTGLKDKDGKAIFKGDIFNVDDDLMALVGFDDGSYNLQIYGLRGAFTENGFDECGGGWGFIESEPMYMSYAEEMEIIGNVHDNPELLAGR